MSINYDYFKFLFEDFDFLCELAFITNLTSHLNDLNLKLPKANQTISQLVSHIDSFRRKLILIKNHVEKNIFHFYPSCQILFEEHGKECDFKKHVQLIDLLIAQFNSRFGDFEKFKKDLILFENPLAVQIEEQNLEFQAELCDLQNDLSLKTRLEKAVEFFKILNSLLYECFFSKLKSTKTDKRSSLSDASLSSLMRVSTLKISS